MKPEEIYDTEIAPALLKIAQRCGELGFSFIANVEWAPAEEGRGTTQYLPAMSGPTRPSAAQLLVHYAARCRGNIDTMLMAVMRDAAKFGHSSIYLKQLGVPLTPEPQPANPAQPSNDLVRA